jgi:hypothetical protein
MLLLTIWQFLVRTRDTCRLLNELSQISRCPLQVVTGTSAAWTGLLYPVRWKSFNCFSLERGV